MLKDSIKDNKRLDEVLTFARLKIEKLAVVSYRVTESISEIEPLRGTLRTCAIEALLLLEHGSSGGNTPFLLRKLSLLCNLAVNARIGSQMNFSILAGEYHSLATILDEELLQATVYETSGAALPALSTAQRSLTEKSDKGQIKDIQEKTSRTSIGGRVERIIAYVGGRDASAIKEIATLFPGVSEKTIQRELLTLVAKGILAKHGERRWSKYSLKTS